MGRSPHRGSRKPERFPFIASDKVVYAIDGVSKFMLHLVLELRGTIQPQRLAESIDLALEKSPICKSIARLRPLAPYWEVMDDTAPASFLRMIDPLPHNIGEDDLHRILEEYVNEYIDITQSPPVHFLLLHIGADQWVLVLKIHHAVMDPLAMTHLLEDVQVYYGKLTKGERIPVPDPMEERGRRLVFENVSWRLWAKVLAVGWSRFRRHRREEKKLRRSHVSFSATNPQSERIGYRSVRVSGQDYLSLRSRSKSLGVTVNDLVMAAICRAVRSWNGDKEYPDGVYSLVLPVDMRRYARKQGRVPRIMSNYVGGTLVNVPVDNVTTLEETVAFVTQETGFIRNQHVGLRHNLMMPLLTFVPPTWLRRKVRNIHNRHPERFAPTAIVAYMGKVDRLFSVFPDCEITRVEGIGTGFTPVGLDVVILAHGKEYMVTLAYPKGACTDEEMSRFVNLLAGEIVGDGR